MFEKKVTVKIDTSSKTVMLIQAVVLLVIGILLCCSIALDNIVNVILGVVFLIGGLINVVSCFMEHKSLVRTEGVFGSALIAFGLLCFLQNAIPLTKFITLFIIVIGAIALIDGILGLLPLVHRKRTPTIVEAVVGVCLLTLGLCLYFIPDFQRFSSVILGVSFIVLSIFLFVSSFLLHQGKRVK